MCIRDSNKALGDPQIYQWISELVSGSNRERALLELGKKREQYDDLALVLWNSFGVMSVLLEEIISVYPYLNPPVLTASISNRVCNALALLQCVASNVQTRGLFLSANLPLYLYPFLSTNARQRSFEYLRLTSLGVIGALVKNDTPEAVSYTHLDVYKRQLQLFVYLYFDFVVYCIDRKQTTSFQEYFQNFDYPFDHLCLIRIDSRVLFCFQHDHRIWNGRFVHLCPCEHCCFFVSNVWPIFLDVFPIHGSLAHVYMFYPILLDDTFIHLHIADICFL